MRKLFVLGALCLVLVIALWAALNTSAQSEGWTTSSKAARAAFERGLEAERRYYVPEAVGHFEEALALDPDFPMAKLKILRLAYGLDRSDRDRIVSELESLDLDRLSDRERFLLEMAQATHYRREVDGKVTIAQSYLVEHPRDPYALEAYCDTRWATQEWEEAESCYQQLLEVAPNWVTAQNRLGYLAMAQGNFEEADKRFRTYRFVAPDQANPHDSLGELLILRGRWDEARAELEEAVRVRPDFCASYSNLVDIGLYRRDAAEARAVLTRLEGAEECRELLPELRCRVELGTIEIEGRWEAAEDLWGSPCLDRSLEAWSVPFLAAVERCDLAHAQGIEEKLRQLLPAELRAPSTVPPLLLFLQGIRLTAKGDFDGATSRYAKADGRLDFWGQRQGMIKLLARLWWAHALELGGDSTTARRLLAEVEAINPSIADDYRAGFLPLPHLCEEAAVEGSEE